ncbi:MAG: hypothetical protein WD512_03430, partial [Candidatus Paceibacterota bacterium]
MINSDEIIEKSKKIKSKEIIKPKEKMTKGQLELLDIYYNHKDKCDHLWIEGMIDYSSIPEGREKIKNIGNQLEEYARNDKIALIVHVNSYGGDSDASFFIYNLLESFPKPKIGVN